MKIVQFSVKTDKFVTDIADDNFPKAVGVQGSGVAQAAIICTLSLIIMNSRQCFGQQAV